MERRDAYVRESGAGVPLVCIHASASSSGQWRPLMDRLAGRFRTLAVDLYGSGKSPDWPADRPLTLADEVALLEPVFASVGDRFHLIGHSYGGAVALKALIEGHLEQLTSGAEAVDWLTASVTRKPSRGRFAQRRT